MKLSIVIPCYNEEKNISLILERFNEVIERDDIEIVLVDNGSTDGSENVLKDLLPKYRFTKTVKVDVNQGYGFGILTGLKIAKGKYIGWTHADMQTDPGDVIKALELIEKRKCEEVFIKGNRKGRGLLDNFFTTGMSFFESLLLKVKLWDINAQPTLFPKSFFQEWEKPPYDFSLDLYAYYMAIKNNMAIDRFTVFFPERIHGKSHWNTGLKAKYKFIKRTVDFSLRLKKGLRQ